ncbi:hypothetical protein FK216_12770 [Moraxellaceae bacterium AER2_44_116]|nr:restriction endonuclease subunit S [Moraxellaceae bacterium]TQC96133.1 hypothetical protein FK216_12770 [Moraxellaceae bacterium AER2_44_116]
MIDVPVGYKQTDVGVIPEDWEVCVFGSVLFDFRGGAPLKPSDFTDRGFQVLPKIGVQKGGLLKLKDTDLQYCSDAYAISHKNNLVNKDFTIIVLRDLVPSGPSIGLMVKIQSNVDFILAQGVYGFKSNLERIYPNYLIQLSNSSPYRKQMNGIMVGSTQVHITNTSFKAASFICPPLKEQTAIATALCDVDALLNQLDKLIAKKRDIKQATMQQLLTGKKRLAGFSGEWEVKKLGDIVIFSNGKAHENHISEHGNFVVVNSKFVSTEGQVRKLSNVCYCLAKIGSLLMVMSDVPNGKAIAKIFLVDKNDKYTVNQRICSLEPLEFIDSNYLFYILNRNKFYLQFDDGAKQTNLRKQDVLDCPIILPPTKDEQTAIATLLTDMDTEITQLQQRRHKTHALKQGMMQQLLTGKIRLI